MFAYHMCAGFCAMLVPQSCPTPCDAMDCSLVRGNSPGKNTGVGSLSLGKSSPGIGYQFSRGAYQPRNRIGVS